MKVETDMLKGYFQLGRPVNALAGVIVVILSGHVAGAVSWWPVIAAAVTVLIITVSTNAWNDYVDIEIDRINKPQRPLPSGRISPEGALIFSIAGTAISLVIAALINPPAFFIAFGSNVLLYLYSWKLKCTVLLGNIAVAAVVALSFIFGGVAAGSIQPILLLSATVFFAILGREILKTMADYKGDLQHNCRTIAIVWGRGISRILVIIFLGITAAVILAAYFIEGYNPVYLYVVALGVYPVFLYIAIHSKATASGQALERLSLFMKYAYFTWFLAVALGAA
jgi:geranylgeranylglycerol-phosphate geranylgeranyltransferase